MKDMLHKINPSDSDKNNKKIQCSWRNGTVLDNETHSFMEKNPTHEDIARSDQ